MDLGHFSHTLEPKGTHSIYSPAELLPTLRAWRNRDWRHHIVIHPANGPRAVFTERFTFAAENQRFAADDTRMIDPCVAAARPEAGGMRAVRYRLRATVDTRSRKQSPPASKFSADRVMVRRADRTGGREKREHRL